MRPKDLVEISPYFETENGILYCGDSLEVLRQLPDESIDCVVTSPPYWGLRDYGVEGQLGLEPTFHEYLGKLWRIFDEVYRVLKPVGTVWVNLGDTYFGGGGGNYGKGLSAKQGNSHPTNNRLKGYKSKCLVMIPERFAIGMIERGWILRNQIIWHKPNAMPESVKDRFTVDFEKIFFFVKQKEYYFRQQFEPVAETSIKRVEYGLKTNNKGKGVAISVEVNKMGRRFCDPNKGRNKRTVWSITTKPFRGAHFAVFPPEIPATCMKAGCPENGVVLDIFLGSGTTALVAEKLHRHWIGIELNPEYCEMAKQRILAATQQRQLF